MLLFSYKSFENPTKSSLNSKVIYEKWICKIPILKDMQIFGKCEEFASSIRLEIKSWREC